MASSNSDVSKTPLCCPSIHHQTRVSPRISAVHYDRGLNNSKLTVWSLITVADGGMRVWHFNGVITTYGKRDCRNSWRYASLALIYSKTPLYCPSIHRQTRVSPRISAVPFSVCSNNPVKMHCFHSDIYLPWLLVYLPWLTGILKSPRCDIIDWHYDRGLNNSKLTVWSSRNCRN
jgi:hypothetical protein